jgi:hypothetical protein
VFEPHPEYHRTQSLLPLSPFFDLRPTGQTEAVRPSPHEKEKTSMTKRKCSTSDGAFGLFFGLSRKVFSLRILMLLTVSLTSLGGVAFAQSSCLGNCEHGLAQCLQTAGDPLAEARCQDSYDACVDACLMP